MASSNFDPDRARFDLDLSKWISILEKRRIWIVRLNPDKAHKTNEIHWHAMKEFYYEHYYDDSLEDSDGPFFESFCNPASEFIRSECKFRPPWWFPELESMPRVSFTSRLYPLAEEFRKLTPWKKYEIFWREWQASSLRAMGQDDHPDNYQDDRKDNRQDNGQAIRQEIPDTSRE